LQALVERIGARLGKYLERRGILAPDVETSYLALDPDSEEDALPDLQGDSNRMRTYRAFNTVSVRLLAINRVEDMLPLKRSVYRSICLWH
jgi:uncharacterized protein YggE